jgi:hypothetical protein
MLNIRTWIRADPNLSKQIRFQIRAENIRTVFIPRHEEVSICRFLASKCARAL